MNFPVNPRPRRYHSVLRAEQAGETRRRVVDAAARLFVERGYAGTSVAAVAQVAGVSVETVYATFGGKRGLLEGVIDATIMGPHAAVPLEQQQAAWNAIARHPTARARLRAYVAFSCAVLARTSLIHHVIRGAADGEPFAVELRARLLRERLASNTKHLGDYVGGELRPGLTLRDAAERYCALTSPEMHHLLTADLGWSLSAHEAWVAAGAEQDLLGPP
jgi:AcrR family transcriptional regulator